MSEFIKVYDDYFNLNISNNAVLLLSFITYRMAVSEYKEDGDPYILLTKDNDPCRFFGWSKHIYRRALKELLDSKIVTSKYLSGTGNKKAIFVDNMQICILCKNAQYNYANLHNYNTQNCIIPFNNKRNSKRNTKRSNTNTSVLSNTNSIDGMAYKNVNSRIPSYEDVKNFSIENNLNFSIQDFIDYYEQRNWSINGEPIKSWKALAHSWSDKQFVRDSRLFGDDSYYFVMSLPEELQQAIYDDQCRNAKGWIRYETKKLVDEYLENQHRVTAIVEYSQKVGGINE